MRNFLNFMGKSLMGLVFSFLTLSVVLTSCSPSDDSEVTQTDVTDVNLPQTYDPTIGYINTYPRTGVSTKLLDLDEIGANSSLKFVITTNSDYPNNSLVEVFNDGRQIRTISSLTQSNIGNKEIEYRVVQPGTSFSTTDTLSFVVHYGQDEQVSVTIDQLNYSDGGILELDDIYDSMVIQNVPWQYVTLMSSNTNLFQLEIYLENGNVDTDPFTNYSGESIFGRITNSVTSSYVSNINVSYKKRNESNIKVFKLRVKLSNNGTYIFGDNNGCDYYNTSVESNFIANCESI